MPKAKPTQVIVHRIELQEKERELIEPFLKAKEVETAAKAAAVVGGVALAGVGVYVAWWTLDTIYDWGQKAASFWDVVADKPTDDPDDKPMPWWASPPKETIVHGLSKIFG